jgi:hypothetical protein
MSLQLEMTEEININLEQSHNLFDREILISKDISESDVVGNLSRFGSFILFYDPFDNISYIKLNKNNQNYYSILKTLSSLDLKVKEISSRTVVELGAFSKDEVEFLSNISSIMGVMRYPFSLMYEKKLYFRFLALEESLEPITKILMDFLDKNDSWNLVYIKKPTSLYDYLKKFNYDKSAKVYILRELDYVNKEENFPHYKCKHLFYLMLNEPYINTERALRFSECLTSHGGIIKESKLIRNGTLKIYEDIRHVNEISFVNIIKDPNYSFPLEAIQYFDGRDVYIKLVVEHDDEKTLFIRMKDYNKKHEGKIEFVLEETMDQL